MGTKAVYFTIPGHIRLTGNVTYERALKGHCNFQDTSYTSTYPGAVFSSANLVLSSFLIYLGLVDSLWPVLVYLWVRKPSTSPPHDILG
jgi:hypothetical protein